MSEEDILDLVLGKLEGLEDRHGYWMAICPVHADAKPSLKVGRGTDQPVMVKCFANCATEDVLAAIGLTMADICAPREKRDDPDAVWTPRGDALAVYDYFDEDGKLLFQVCRAPGKQFPQRVPDPGSPTGWRWRLGDTRRVLYRLPRLRPAIDAGEIIWVVEGEKDVHAVERAGAVATCNPGGAGKWRDEYSETLRDAIVIIVADGDKPGRAHAHQVARALDGIAAAVEIREAAEGKDISDHLAAGRGLSETVLTAEVTPEVPSELAMDVFTFIEQPDPPQRWVIDGLLERGDRLMWTGWEGLGKTTVVRQVAMCAAAGIQPFSPSEHIPPQSVLFIDCENRINRSRRQFRELIGKCQRYRPVPRGQFRVVHRPDGINLLSSEGAAFVLERVTAYKPDLIVIGPLYKLHLTDANEETAAHAIIRVLELAVEVCDSGLIVEAHSPHGEPRTLRPRGSSVFMAWPDSGLGIAFKDPPAQRRGQPQRDPDPTRVGVHTWRGSREDYRWPRELIWGAVSELPWVVPMDAWKQQGNPHADTAAGE